MAAAPLTTVVRTRDQADATRPNPVVNNAFRREDLFTNEGRSWYHGVRASGRHQSQDHVASHSFAFMAAKTLRAREA